MRTSRRTYWKPPRGALNALGISPPGGIGGGCTGWKCEGISPPGCTAGATRVSAPSGAASARAATKNANLLKGISLSIARGDERGQDGAHGSHVIRAADAEALGPGNPTVE